MAFRSVRAETHAAPLMEKDAALMGGGGGGGEDCFFCSFVLFVIWKVLINKTSQTKTLHPPPRLVSVSAACLCF